MAVRENWTKYVALWPLMVNDTVDIFDSVCSVKVQTTNIGNYAVYLQSIQDCSQISLRYVRCLIWSQSMNGMHVANAR